MTIRTISALTLCAMLSALGTPASANPQTGTLSGQVRNAYGKPVAGARVVIAEIGETTMTDSSGNYNFTGENPGTYTISAQSVRYIQETLKAVIQPDLTQKLDFILVHDAVNLIQMNKIVKPDNFVKPHKAVIDGIFAPYRPAPLDPFANLPQETLRTDVGLHSTARSR